VIAQKRVRADKERPESSRIAEDREKGVSEGVQVCPHHARIVGDWAESSRIADDREKAVRDDHDHPKTPMIEKKRSAPIRNTQNR